MKRAVGGRTYWLILVVVVVVACLSSDSISMNTVPNCNNRKHSHVKNYATCAYINADSLQTGKKSCKI